MSVSAPIPADPCASILEEIRDRLGVLPAMYRRATTPDILEHLWNSARFSYLDNPLPALLKERLLVFLSRFCPVRYCLARHVGFLVGSGRPAGDPSCVPETVEQALRLLRQPMDHGDDLDRDVTLLLRRRSPLARSPSPETVEERAVLSCTAHLFLRTSQASRCHSALRRGLGPGASEHLAVLLTYARAVHDWVRMHPEIELDEDVETLLARHPDLADAVLRDSTCALNREPTTTIVSDTRVGYASLLDAIVDLIPTSVFVKDADALSFVLVNRANEELLGLSRTAQLGRTDHDFFPEEEAEFFQQKDREALASDHVIDIPQEPIHTPLGVRWLHTRKISVRDAAGRPTHLLGISSDITEQKRVQEELVQAHQLLESRVQERTSELRKEIEDRKRIEEALRASEELFRLAVEAFEGIIYDLDLATGHVVRSPGMQVVLGYDPQAAPTTVEWWMDQVHPDDRARVDLAYRHLGDHPDGRLKIEYRVRHRDGRWRTVDERALVRPNAEGRLTRVVGCAVDVTERVEALQALRASEADARRHHEELEEIYATSPVGMCVLDADLRFVRLNARIAEMNGVPIADHIGRTVREVVPGVADEAERILLPILRSGEAVTDQELTGETPSQPGVLRMWLVSYYPQKVDGRVVGVNVVAQEITERKRADLLLREHNRVLELIASGCTLEATLDSICHGLTGLTPDGRACIELTDPTGPSGRRTFAPDFPVPLDHCHDLQTCHGAPILAPDGTSSGTLMVCFDEGRGPRDWERRLVEFGTRVANIALERDRATRAVRESEAMFRTLGEAMEDLLWMSDVDGVPIYRNPAWYAYTGTSAEEPLSERWSEVIHPDDRAHVMAQRTEAHRVGHAFQAQIRCRRHDGQYRWFQSRSVPVKDAHGRVVRWVGTATDVHDLKQAKEALKEADARKDAFLATLAHELRNPLAPIRHALRLIEQSDEPGVVAHARAIMERQVGHMIVLVDDLLDVSRISSGKVALRREPIDVAAAIDQGVEAARPLVDQSGHRLTVTLPGQRVVVDGDLTRLAQVVGNLLTNSAKYTPPGGDIRVAVERQGHEVVITVSDTGIGIPPAELDRVFDLFSQVDRSLERASGGLGIGLSLVRGLVQMHGGTVTAASEGEGRGSTFTVRLPALDVGLLRAPEPSAAVPPACPGRKVLVVDDNADGAELLAELIRLAGDEVRTARDGLEAVAVAETFRPDLILMDVAMPRMNGLDATRRIRSEPWGRALRIVALSGWGQDSDRERSTAAGCDDHLVKPVDPRRIEELLASLGPCRGPEG